MLLERLHDDFLNAGRPDPLVILGIVLLAFGAIALVVGAAYAAMTGTSSFLSVTFGFLLVAFGTIVLGVISPQRRRSRGPRIVNPTCPKCGAPPKGQVSAAGLTTCAGCGNPYFVF